MGDRGDQGSMKREIMQIGRDAESLTRYIMDHGDEANPLIIDAQARLLAIHVNDFMDLTRGSGGKDKDYKAGILCK